MWHGSNRYISCRFMLSRQGFNRFGRSSNGNRLGLSLNRLLKGLKRLNLSLNRLYWFDCLF